MNLDLLGYGRIGKVHARSLWRMKDAELVAVADAVPDAAEALARSSGA